MIRKNITVFAMILLAIGALTILISIDIVDEYEKVVLLKLGKLKGELGPGVHFIPPVIYKEHKLSLRTVTKDIDPQDVVTKDNVSVNVDAVLYYRVTEPTKTVLKLEDYKFAIEELSQATLRSVCGKSDFDQLNSERQKLNVEMKNILKEKTNDWGIDVENIEIKHITLHEDMQTIMAQKAIAYRNAESLIINSEAELEAANNLQEAAKILKDDKIALMLRQLSSLEEISKNESTILVPLPEGLINAIK